MSGPRRENARTVNRDTEDILTKKARRASSAPTKLSFLPPPTRTVMRSPPRYSMMASLVTAALMTLAVHGFVPFPRVMVPRMRRSSDTQGDSRSLPLTKGARPAGRPVSNTSMLRREGGDGTAHARCHTGSIRHRETTDSTNGTPSACLSVIAPVVFGRRLALLLVSISVVNFTRSKIMKIPQKTTGMFDECPWPFTLAHDPTKFFKTGATYSTILWAILCWTYGKLGTAFLVVPK